MREGGTLSLVETKVVSITFLLGVFPLQLIAMANGATGESIRDRAFFS
jgi:hypothetical protein